MNRLVAVLGAALLAACSKAPPPNTSAFENPDVLAVVGTEPITRADFEAARARRPAPSEALLDELIEHRALVQIARERGYDRDPQSVAAFEAQLANRVREEGREARKREVTPAEIEARYRAEEKKFTLPAKVRAAMIFIEAPASFSEEKRTERRAAIEAVRAKAASDPDQFAALAAEFSYDQATKYRGGDLGWLVENIGAEELDAPLLAAIFALKNPGDLSEIVTTPKGFHLLKLTERTGGTVRPLSEVTDRIRSDLQREKQQQSDQQLAAEYRASRKVEIRRDRLPASPGNAPPGRVNPPAIPAAR